MQAFLGYGGRGGGKEHEMTHDYQFQSSTLYISRTGSCHQDFWYTGVK